MSFLHFKEVKKVQEITFRKNVKKYRTKNKLSKTELSKKAGLSSRTVEYIEKGILNNPRLSTLNAISKALNVEIKDLIE